MPRRSHPFIVILGVALLSLTFAVALDAQGRAGRRPPAPPDPPVASVVFSGHVFIGGYFYDPVFGPYPWWQRARYPYWYFPVYDRRAELRVIAKPEDAAVYVDGFYAGIVDDFDGVFQRLPLPPGAHTVVVYLEGYRTEHHNVYLRPASTLTLHSTLRRLPAGEVSELPPVAPPVPPPPYGTYRTPRTPPPLPVPAQAPVSQTAAGFGTLEIRVQPVSAELTIDGQTWVSSAEGRFIVQVPAGRHRVEVMEPGYRPFSTELDVRDGQTTPLNVSLMGTEGS